MTVEHTGDIKILGTMKFDIVNSKEVSYLLKFLVFRRKYKETISTFNANNISERYNVVEEVVQYLVDGPKNADVKRTATIQCDLTKDFCDRRWDREYMDIADAVSAYYKAVVSKMPNFNPKNDYIGVSINEDPDAFMGGGNFTMTNTGLGECHLTQNEMYERLMDKDDPLIILLSIYKGTASINVNNFSVCVQHRQSDKRTRVKCQPYATHAVKQFVGRLYRVMKNVVKEIKEKKFDKVFIFNGSLRFKLLGKIAGIKEIHQYPLFRKKDNIVTSAKTFTEYYIKENVSTEPKLVLDKELVYASKEKYGFDKKQKHICIGFSASGPTKRWDVEKYINLAKELKKRMPCKFYLAGGKNDEILFAKFLNSSIASDCMSFKDVSIKDSLSIIKNCDIYVGNDTGWLHISSALNLKCLALFMDSPVLAYGKYSKNISTITPEGETDETTTHGTLGKNKINFEEVLKKTLSILN